MCCFLCYNKGTFRQGGFLMLYAYLGLILGIAFLVIQQIIFTNGTYHKATKKSYLQTRLDLGSYGEYLIYKELKHLEKQGAKFLFNCYLPREDGDTTEIDVIMLYRNNIFVFESKNYSGWIFGNEHAKTWTQTLPQGKSAHKEHFLNPILQNRLHIKALQDILQEECSLHSIIAFSDRCVFKDVEIHSEDIQVIHREHVATAVRNVLKRTDNKPFSDAEAIFMRLYPYTQADEAIRQEHIANIQKRIAAPEPQNIPAVNICPRCGGKLVLRTASKGEHKGKTFYGCSNYPKCRYIQNTDTEI